MTQRMSIESSQLNLGVFGLDEAGYGEWSV